MSHKKLDKSTAIKVRRKLRIKKSLRTNTYNDRKRIVISKSNKFLYVQVIDDQVGKTLINGSTREDVFKNESSKTVEAAKKLGVIIGNRLLNVNLKSVLFDRNGYSYHGRVKALADGIREAGIAF